MNRRDVLKSAAVGSMALTGKAKALNLRDKLRAIRAERARRKARDNLLSFIQYTRPEYKTNWHHALTCQAIDDWLVADPPYNLILSMPPQHGKSEICSRFLPPYLLGKNPDCEIVCASYGANLIEGMSKDAQRVIESPEYHQLFPQTTITTKGNVADDMALRRADHFTIQRRRGRYRCAGIGGALAGYPAQYGIIDDPLKNREEAESKTRRETCVSWYHTVFRTRLHRPGGILMLLTRWHVDDLAGHVLKKMQDDPKADHWKYIVFKAIYEASEYNHPDDPRQEGQALWPEFQNEAYLGQTRATLTAYDWYSIYQQEPSPPGGNVIKRAWLQVIESTQIPVDLTWVRFWDIAVTEKTKADFTASGMMAISLDGNIYVKDLIRDQVEWPEARRMFIQQAKTDQVPVGIETSATQKGFFQDLLTEKELRGIAIYGYSPDTSKLVRAQPWIARAEAGKFFIVRGPGVDNYVDELVEFTGMDDTHDDQVDWTSGAYHMLASDTEAEMEVVGQYDVS